MEELSPWKVFSISLKFSKLVNLDNGERIIRSAIAISWQVNCLVIEHFVFLHC